MIREQKLETKQCEDALHTERPPVHKVSVEEVGVGLRRQTVELEHIHKVIVLSVYVSAHCELCFVWHFYIYEGGLRL